MTSQTPTNQKDGKLMTSHELTLYIAGHPLASDERFTTSLTEALAKLHSTATLAERIAVLNGVSAEYSGRLDAETLDKARASGARAERTRIRQILTSPAAYKKSDAARRLALETDLPAEAAIEQLQASVKDDPLAGWWNAPEPSVHAPEAQIGMTAKATHVDDLWRKAIDGINAQAD